MTPSSKPVLNFVIAPELLARVDDFRFENRFKSRAAAIKWLMAAGLDAGLKPDRNPSLTVATDMPTETVGIPVSWVNR